MTTCCYRACDRCVLVALLCAAAASACAIDGESGANDSSGKICFEYAQSAYYDGRSDLGAEATGSREPRIPTPDPPVGELGLPQQDAGMLPGTPGPPEAGTLGSEKECAPRAPGIEPAGAAYRGVVRATVAIHGPPDLSEALGEVTLPNVRVVSDSGEHLVTDDQGNFVGAPGDVHVTVHLVGTAASVHSYVAPPVVATQPAAEGVSLNLAEDGNPGAVAQTTAFYYVDRARQFLLGAGVAADQLPPILVFIGPTRDAACQSPSGGLSLAFASDAVLDGACPPIAEAGSVLQAYGRLADRMIGGSADPGLAEAWGDLLWCFARPGADVAAVTNAPVPSAPCGNDYQFVRGDGEGSGGSGSSWSGFGWRLRELLVDRYGEDEGVRLAALLLFSGLAADASSVPEAVLHVVMADDDNDDASDGTPNLDLIETAAAAHGLDFLFELDKNPPRAVTDLSFDEVFQPPVSGDASRRFTLTWSASGDDGGTGQALEERILRSEVPLTGDNLAGAEVVYVRGAPLPAGSAREVTLEQPLATTRYYSLLSFDNALNSSALSNIVEVATP